MSIRSLMRLDPRWYQIGSLALLLTIGITRLGFDVTPARVATFVVTALLTQYACTKLWRLPKFDPKSAFITSMSLSLLLRTGSTTIAIVAAVFAIASKFVIRYRGKHFFNPANGAIAFVMLLTDNAWVSPGQWGSTTFIGFLVLCLGGMVVNRAARSDITYAFLILYVGAVFARFVWLGDPLAIPLHRLQSGALLLFAFFMISDPKSTPDSRSGRMLFSALVAGFTYYIQFKMFRSDALIWALAIISLLTPLIDRLLPGSRYDWNHPTATPKGTSDEKTAPLAPLAPAPAA